MRWFFLLAGVLLLWTPTIRAGERTLLERCAERTPRPIFPVVHTDQRAGYPRDVSSHAIPSVTRFDNAGYVGGARLWNNNLLARGPGAVTGPVQAGTFATDYTGLRAHLGRVFLAPSNDPSRGYPISWNYRPEGPRLLDLGMPRPLRKAVLEMRHDAEERRYGGKESHKEGAHAPEGAEKH